MKERIKTKVKVKRDDLLKFGWKEVSINSNRRWNEYILERDTSIPNYEKIVKLEEEYFSLEIDNPRKQEILELVKEKVA